MPCITNYVKYLLHSQENLLKDYQIGTWFEGFTLTKTSQRKPDTKPPKNCLKRANNTFWCCQLAMASRLCVLWSSSPWRVL